MPHKVVFSASLPRLQLILQLLWGLLLPALYVEAGAPLLRAQDPVSAAVDDASDSQREQRLQALRLRAQQDDIATASYFELQELARELGIEPNSDTNTLRAALYNKLHIPAPASEIADQEDLVIRIESAQKAKAFTVERQEDDSEDYFKISGGVKVYITDKREGYEHSVYADTITFNRKQNIIRAEGQVIYIQKKLDSNDDNDTEKFTGDSLIFRLRVWRGVIFYGVFSRAQTTETQRPIDVHASSSNPEKTEPDPDANTTKDDDSLLGENVLAQNNIHYYFDGEKMRKGSDDVLVLEKGAISTSESEETEYFRLGFHRLWIFGKPEWAMLSATLYVGHIPVLYLPYYYHNDSQILFHPVFGLGEAYGQFIQTTTYLLGKPEAGSTDSFSFLPVNSGADEDSELKLEALHLVAADNEDKKKSKLGADSYLKFMLDYYSYVGIFSGIDGNLKDLGIIDSLVFNDSLAYAYSLEERTGAGFATAKPYILGDDGKYSLQPVETNLFGLALPFRYGFENSLSSENDFVNIDFKHYSDPFFRRDYLNRKEIFDWLGYGLERMQSDNDKLLEKWRKKESVISSYKWEIGLNLRPRFRTSLISSFEFKAYLASYFDKKTDSERKAYDPTREFFYPDKFFLPDTSLRMSGTIWPLQQDSQQSKYSGDLPILKDWKYQPNSDETNTATDQEAAAATTAAANAGKILRKPEGLEKIKRDEQVKTVSFETTYNLTSQNLMESNTDNDQWTRVEDIELNNKELEFSGREALQLVTGWKIFDDFLNIDLQHSLDAHIAHYFDIADQTEDSNDLTATKQANKWNWSEESDIVLRPLHLIDWFANTSITHNIQAVMYDYKYNVESQSHEGTFLDLRQSDAELRERITAHSLVTLLDFQPIKDAYNPINNLQVSISMTNALPPLEPENTLKNRLFFEFFHWSHDVSIEFQQSGDDDPDFYVQPLNYTSIYKPIAKVELKNMMIYNFEAEARGEQEPHFDKEEISFNAWWFSGGLYFRYTQPYVWDKQNLGWQAKGDLELILDKTFLAFELTTKERYLWKNRMLYYFTLNMRWDQDLIRYNETSSLTLDFTFSFFIYEFLNLQISYRMSNERLYLYYPGMKEFLGFTQDYSLLQDLLNSVSFWDENLQKKGLFKMKDIRVLAIHHLKDWDMIFEFAGKPKQVGRNLSWDYAIGFYLRWIPIPLIKRHVTFENDILRTDAR